MSDDDELPDLRDGLTRKERVVLWMLSKAQAERGDRAVPLPVLYGRVLEHEHVEQWAANAFQVLLFNLVNAEQ